MEQKNNILGKDFFDRSVVTVAKELIGYYLVVFEKGREPKKFLITETEAYDGEKDLACHASKGRTGRTEILYGEPGTFYIYLCYGIHYMLNVVAREKDYPAAVLIRGLEGVSGPGRVTKTLGIDKRLNGLPTSPSSGIWFEQNGAKKVFGQEIVVTPRIGVDYAGKWAKKPYRFVLRQGKK